MTQKLEVINVFATPYEEWSTRRATMEEALELINKHGFKPIEAMNVNDRLVEAVTTHTQAAARILRVMSDNALESHIDRALDASQEYRVLQNLMPRRTPASLASYQGEYEESGLGAADEEIRTHGVPIAEGQYLFHGGLWAASDDVQVTSRPFSTSFCPQVALRNAEWKGKAYNAGRVDLMVVRVTNPKTKAFAYNRTGNHGNEKEIVFASGARLTRVRQTYIREYPVSRVTSGFRTEEKDVPAYLIEVDIS